MKKENEELRCGPRVSRRLGVTQQQAPVNSQRLTLARWLVRHVFVRDALSQHLFSPYGRATLKASTAMLETELKRVCASSGHTYTSTDALESVL